ncbi:MAG: hypothetical protein ACK4S0_13680, partial [Sediminibacterium sp.]
MQPYDLHPEFYNHPIWLNEEEKQKPIIVIKQFFVDVRLIEVRENLAKMLEVCMTASNSIYNEAQVRDVALYFWKQF